MAFDTIEHWGVDKDGNKTLIYRTYTVEGQPVPDTTPDPPDPDPVPLAGVITQNGVRVRNAPTTIGTEVIGVFNLGSQAFFEDKTYPPTTDNNSWVKVVKVNGGDDPRIGGYVAKQFVDFNEGTPIPPKVPPPNRGGIWWFDKFVVGNQVIPVFTKSGQKWPIFMANKRTLAYEGKNIAPFQFSEARYRDFTLDRLKLAGINTIRFYAPLLGHDDQWMIDRIKEALDVLQGRFTAFITLMDCVDGGGDSPHRFAEDQPFYKNGYITPQYFTQKQYNARMLPFATKLVKQLKGRDVAFYSVGNEVSTQYQGNATDAQLEACVTFLHTVADMIHAESPNSMVTPGLLNISHLHNGNGTLQELWDKVYNGKFDFATVSFYEKLGQLPGDDWDNEKLALKDLEFCRRDGIPLLGAEQWRHNGNPNGTEAIKQKWIKWGNGYGVELSGWAADFGPDRNVTDREHGWSAAFDPQWEGSLAYIADVYYGQRKAAYGVNW